MHMIILGIETSCDETGIALGDGRLGKRPFFRLMSNVLASQTKVHAKWGGVVPNLAAREHEKNLVPVLTKALGKAGLLKIKNEKLKSKNHNEKLKIIKTILQRELYLLKTAERFLRTYEVPKIDVIAVTYGPGLEIALWSGVNFAKALAFAWNKPIIPVNHLEAHILVNFISKAAKIETLGFPALCLVVSGGHTQLVLMQSIGKYKIIGETLDDAAGEAFDKVAKMLGLGFPGGPAISRLAKEGKENAFLFPRPMLRHKNYNFSFAGLKTAVLYTIQKQPHRTKEKEFQQNIAASFEQAVVDVLVAKTIRAAHEHKVKHILLGGGVAANTKLRAILAQQIKKHLPHARFWQPNVSLATDNAAMVAACAYFRYRNDPSLALHWSKVEADANLSLGR